MLALTRLFKGLINDTDTSDIPCSTRSALQAHAAGRSGLPADGPNCLSTVFQRGNSIATQNYDDDARPDTGPIKNSEVPGGCRVARRARLFKGPPSKGVAARPDTITGRIMRAASWMKFSAPGPRETRHIADAMRIGGPKPPTKLDLGFSGTSTTSAANLSVKERATCLSGAVAPSPGAEAPTAPERHTFPKAQSGKPRRPAQNPGNEPTSDGDDGSVPPGAGAAKCGGQLLPPLQEVAASNFPSMCNTWQVQQQQPSCHPGGDPPVFQCTSPPRQRQQADLQPQRCVPAIMQQCCVQHRSPSSQPQQQQPTGQDLSAAADQDICQQQQHYHHYQPRGDGLLFLAADVPETMLPPDGCWSSGGYRISSQLHRGYASSVFKAVCRRSGSDVVLKAYNLAGLSDFLLYQMLRELDIHSRLQHGGVVRLLAAFKECDTLVMVLEYAGGGSACRVRLKLGGRMTEFQAMHLVLLPLLGVLSYLHDRGVVHRDIKPENLLFTEDWKLKLCDFGVSICLREERAVTRTGSREYMAPEVNICPLKRGPEDNKDNPALAYGSSVDVWSLGALMYELLVGFTPFPGGPPTRRGDGERGSAGAGLAFPSSVSQGARAFVRLCLELDPADRPTVNQLLEHAWVQEALANAAGGLESALVVAEERRRDQRRGAGANAPNLRDRHSATGP